MSDETTFEDFASTTIKAVEAPTITIVAADGRALLKIGPDGHVEGEIEDASEAGRRFVEAIRENWVDPARAWDEGAAYATPHGGGYLRAIYLCNPYRKDF